MNKKLDHRAKSVKKDLEIALFSLKGEKRGKLAVKKEIFGQEVNKSLIAQSVRVYLSNQRRAKAKTKTRGEISGSTRKIWRQKGTGRARHGDRYAPIFVGGGVAHGPRGKENWQLKLPKKMKRKALFSALASKFNQERIIAVADLEQAEPKTKIGALFLKKIFGKKKAKILFIINKGKSQNFFRAFRNLSKVKIVFFDQLNPYLILDSGWLIFSRKSLLSLEKYWFKNGTK